MKDFLRRGLNLLLSSILVLLGFESCGDDGDEPLLCEYGVPQASYVYKGKVTNPQGSPVEGERIIVKKFDNDGNPRHYFENDTIYTDIHGEIHEEKQDFPTQKFRLVAEDPSGRYEADSVDVLPKRIGKGDGGWNEGKFEVSADFKLRKKTEK